MMHLMPSLGVVLAAIKSKTGAQDRLGLIHEEIVFLDALFPIRPRSLKDEAVMSKLSIYGKRA